MDRDTVEELRAKLSKNFDEFNGLMETMNKHTAQRLFKGIATKAVECKKLSTPIPKPTKPDPADGESGEGEEGEDNVDPYLLEDVRIGGYSLPDKITDKIPSSIYDKKYEAALMKWKIAEAERKS